MMAPEPLEACVPGSPIARWTPTHLGDRDRILAFLAGVASSPQVGDVPDGEDVSRNLADWGIGVQELAWSGSVLVGYGALAKRDDTDETHDLSLTLILRPDWRTAQMRGEVESWLASRTRWIRTRLAHSHDLRIYASTQRDDSWGAELLTGCGFRMERAFADMRVALPISTIEPDRGGDCHVVRFSSPFADAVRAACNEAFDGHWGTTPWSPELWHDDVIGHPTFLPDLSFLVTASSGKTVEAFVLTSDARSGGQVGRTLHIDLVGTRSASRGAGLATRLLRQTLQSAAAQGYGEATLFVDTDGGHGALAMYRRLGFKADDESLHWCLCGVR